MERKSTLITSSLLERETIIGISRLADSLDTGMARVSKLKSVVKPPGKQHASYPGFDLNRPDNAEDDSISHGYPPPWSLSLHHDMLQMLLTDPAFPVSMEQRHRHLCKPSEYMARPLSRRTQLRRERDAAPCWPLASPNLSHVFLSVSPSYPSSSASASSSSSSSLHVELGDYLSRPFQNESLLKHQRKTTRRRKKKKKKKRQRRRRSFDLKKTRRSRRYKCQRSSGRITETLRAASACSDLLPPPTVSLLLVLSPPVVLAEKRHPPTDLQLVRSQEASPGDKTPWFARPQVAFFSSSPASRSSRLGI
ncbi:hypothetical protein TEQG_03570 [Trichophyton equinum CBS 127.97]|uniref:Uncharacterized protein n=1 Tax=Trichophyton equinum (strain ATCC MYA-4606 / CBS 127.97) TaxID=559882 RepID=F2PR49_TRIEC|nr:hypothetical protein TEQG_03570 [Trichophyton equinum CBS 127.97]